MGKIVSLAFLFGIGGLFMGVAIGLLLNGGKVNDQDQRLTLHMLMSIGWGAGGIIGALTGIGRIVEETCQRKLP